MNALAEFRMPEHSVIRSMVARHMVKQQATCDWVDMVGGCDDHDMVPLTQLGDAKDMRDTSTGSLLESAA